MIKFAENCFKNFESYPMTCTVSNEVEKHDIVYGRDFVFIYSLPA